MFDRPSAPDSTPGLLARLPAGVLLAALSIGLAVLAITCIHLISAARAYVGGESQWSKGQKAAVLALVRYAESHDDVDWQRYQAAIAVPLGDRRAREALERPDVDLQIVREGFLAGANHADDIDGMRRLYRWFRRVPFMDRTIAIWAEGDGLIAELQAQAQRLRSAVQARADADTLRAPTLRLLALDQRLTPLEDRFSQTLGEASRLIQTLLTVVMVFGSLGLTAVAVGVLRHGDRHASRQAQALHESEARRLRALNGSSDGFFEWDLRRRQAYLSPRFEHLLGLPPGALTNDVGLAQALLHPDDRAGARAALKAHLQDGKPYDVELRMRHADGGWRWLRSRASADRGPNGDELRLSGSISDVTERRHAEDELRRREVQFRSLWETTSDAVLILDAEGRIAFANPAAHTLFGVAPGTLAGQPMAQLQPMPQRAEFADAMTHYQTTGERHFDWLGTETIGLHHDGHTIPLEVRISEFTLDGQRQFVGFLRDISQRKATEQALLDAKDRLEHHVAARTSELTQANERLREVDRLKSEFLATMSHELRTPLNSVLGFTSILLSGQPGPLNEEQKRQLGFVHGSGHHLLQLINDLLDLSRIESGYLELVRTDFDVAALVADVCDQLQPMADAKGLTLARTVPPTLTLRSDRRRAYQVLLNLVNNALKFTADGEVRIEVERAGRELLLRVHDTGIGIAAAELAGLFQPFRQVDNSLARTHEGTGLGLYLSRRLTELMGGRISVESTLGQGSCFTLALPLPQAEDSRHAAETRTTMLR